MKSITEKLNISKTSILEKLKVSNITSDEQLIRDLSNEDTFVDTFKEIWKTLGQEATEVNTKHVNQDKYYIAISKKRTGDYSNTNMFRSIILLQPSGIEGYYNVSLIEHVSYYGKVMLRGHKYLRQLPNQVIPRKSERTGVFAKQIYELPESLEYLVNVINEAYAIVRKK